MLGTSRPETCPRIFKTEENIHKDKVCLKKKKRFCCVYFIVIFFYEIKVMCTLMYRINNLPTAHCRGNQIVYIYNKKK